MCDFNSFLAAYADFGSAQAGKIMADAELTTAKANRIDIESRAQLEAAQMEAYATLAKAQASSDIGRLNRDYARQFRSNAAAIAISGFASNSFDSITEGNVKDQQRNEQDIVRKAAMQASGYRAGARLGMLEGQVAGRLAQLAGVSRATSIRIDAAKGYSRAGGRLMDAERAFQQYRTPGMTRMDSFMRSMGFD